MKLAFSKGLNYIYIGAGHFRSAVADLFFLRPYLFSFLVGVLLNLAAWAIAAGLAHSIGDNLAVLHYNVIFGIDNIGAAARIYFLPLAGFAIGACNFVAAAAIAGRKRPLLALILATTSALANLLAVLSLYFIYLVNFS